MKKLFAALAMFVPLTAWSGEWVVNDKNVAVTVAETTSDILGVDICAKGMILAAPITEGFEKGKAYSVHATLRIDEISPWNINAKATATDELIITVLELTPQLFSELIQGRTMRIKWGPDIYTRFDLIGLTDTLSKINCDSKFFPKSDDSDYFL